MADGTPLDASVPNLYAVRGEGMRLEIVPLTFQRACEFVERHHRHHGPPRGAKFCLGVVDEQGDLRGVAIVGRPVARAFDDGRTAEVNRRLHGRDTERQQRPLRSGLASG